MFNLFKRSKVLKEEAELLANVFSKLGAEYFHYASQVKAGLLKGVFFQSKPFSNYVGFTYDEKVVSSFEDKKVPYHVLRGIKVFDEITKEFVELRIYLAFGLIVGYSTPHNVKVEINPSKIKVGNVTKQYFENNDFNSIARLLSKHELDLINASEVYEVSVKNKLMYHLMDLQDGDFIAIDIEKKVYKISHDPYVIEELAQPLAEVLGQH